MKARLSGSRLATQLLYRLNNMSDVGYLKRAVEELTDYVKAHMDREEREREFLLEELTKINDKIDSIELRLTSLKLVIQVLKIAAGMLVGLAVFNNGGVLDLLKLF